MTLGAGGVAAEMPGVYRAANADLERGRGRGPRGEVLHGRGEISAQKATVLMQLMHKWLLLQISFVLARELVGDCLLFIKRGPPSFATRTSTPKHSIALLPTTHHSPP
ncbi:uncharacterized protein BDR25DRAFT_112748 [Lindgomyces ingoldianus]|uniref:Uncharacterized protein n=1 Tax=Lindgomyces ingoldianus TaxID=673940 RepID=A0ACB6R6U0_9PLEO|nr:uncharacterized protein BDR25DRAFT_112748 [Lindgomyces ingoldianus]KAF2474881.1 hypothetical protein BDR25DRAFT_112748 [Lindgomyces ingoldianus]